MEKTPPRRIAGFRPLALAAALAILLLLASIAVPLHLQWLEASRAAPAVQRMGTLAAAAKAYHGVHDRWPGSAGDLRLAGFVPDTLRALAGWDVRLHLPDSLVAVSTPAMPGGAGKRVVLEVPRWKTRGYGQVGGP